MTIEEKILTVIFDLYKKGQHTIDYEDLIVHAYIMFPQNFSLKKYPQYPDSNSINKKLYDSLKPKGYIIIKNLKIKLTDHGKTVAKRCYNHFTGQINFIELKDEEKQLTKNENIELKRLLLHKGFSCYLENSDIEILDIDIFDFFQISARTKTSDAKNRVSIIKALIKKVNKSEDSRLAELSEYYNLILEKYKEFQK